MLEFTEEQRASALAAARKEALEEAADAVDEYLSTTDDGDIQAGATAAIHALVLPTGKSKQ